MKTIIAKIEVPDIVYRAITDGVTDIGQLTKEEIKNLNKYIKMGWLVKIKNYSWYPIPKPYYCGDWGFFHIENGQVEFSNKFMKDVGLK